MPLYIFEHPKTGEVKEILQGMNDEHIYFEGKTKWKRIFTSPHAFIDGAISPMSAQKFIEKTDAKGTVGDVLDRARDLSEQRKKIYGGKDPVQEKWFDKYSEKRQGKRHPMDERPAKPTKLKKRK